ncbi:MAG: transcription antitermination protein NusB, partial [Ruminococcus sp.]|nr:transcription antitermination protein NusB [Ruminococcus sp.]
DFDEDACRLFRAVSERAEELDGVIARYSEKRSVDRICKVSVAVLRIAVYECLYEEDIPANIAASEAVKISQKYSPENDTAFVNGVLGKFTRSGDLPEAKRPAVTEKS